MKHYLLLIGLLLASATLAGCLPPDTNGNQNNNTNKNTANVNSSNNNKNFVATDEGVDDWEYTPSSNYEESFGSSGLSITSTSLGSPTGSATGRAKSMQPQAVAFEAAVDDELGFAVGGSKDINAFRDDIEQDFLPIHSDITYEGLFFDYFFDTGLQDECDKLFCPSYSYAISQDPISNNDDYYLSVGLNSGIKESDFQRKKLNLVVVMDISGSMGSEFSSYYYDDPSAVDGNIDSEKDPDAGKTKMQVANESVVELLGHLNDDDKFGMVLFDDEAYLAKLLRSVGETDMEAIKSHVIEIQDNGGTNMESGMKMATTLYDELGEVDYGEYENRIIFVTDAMPNTGITDDTSLLSMVDTNAQNKIYSTMIGVGVDFNTELIESITDTTGANYFTVNTAAEFKEQMDDNFNFMVTPLVFNLQLQLEADGYDIEQVYGSPQADASTGEIMNVKTLFPSASEDGETRGGLVLLKLKKTSDNPSLTLRTSYNDRYGNSDGEESSINLSAQESNYYDNTGIRKGIVLARYADLMKNWIIDERSLLKDELPIEDRILQPAITEDIGIIIPAPDPQLGTWERQSNALVVSSGYNELITTFAEYFRNEMNAIGDEDMQQELDILEKLKDY